MQPTNYNVPPGELPRPQYKDVPTGSPSEQSPVPAEVAQSQAIEQGMAPAGAPMPAPADPAALAQPYPMDPMSQTTGSNVGSNVSPHSPQLADDTDLIEKEWVMKAKHIVEQTKADPYMQTKEMNKMKADYLKKRYAKELKLPED
jgi:hypothetical protein